MAMALEPPPSSAILRFGVFEVDTRARELRKKGVRVKLQDQPFRVLALLLKHAGEVVSREELRSHIWGSDTFIDFDRGLNTSINKLRETLGDSADKPTFIETLPRRGYKFIAQVEKLRSRHAPQIDSLAVLPLDNLCGDPAEEYFCDGLTEELICALARIASLRVISRTSAMSYKGSRKSLPEVAKELCVDAVVEGSVARSDQRVRINVQLILAPEDRHLWSGRYERDLRDIVQLQAEVAQSIASQIHKFFSPEHAHPLCTRRVDPRAYEACLKGIFFRDKMTPADLEKSIGLFKQAIDLDPSYARAFGDLSRAYFYLGVFGIGLPQEMFLKARANAAKALELDESVASAHAALAAVHIFYDWDWAAAEAESRRAVELSPGESVTHAHFADYLSIRGRHSEAIAAYSRVLELDPISRVFIGHFGLILYRARRYDESIAQCYRALEIDPTYANALWFLALSLEQKGELGEAIAKLEKAVSVTHGSYYQALLGRAYALVGERTKTLDILSELETLSEQIYVSPFDIAVAYVGLGDLTSAFQWFEKAYEQRVWRIIELTMPMFDNLRSDPRWQDLVHRIGLQK